MPSFRFYAYVIAIFGVPAVLAGLPLILFEGWFLRLGFLVASPLVFALSYGVTAGLLSRPHQRFIVPGVFPRSFDNEVYRNRRLYGLCWTAVYYFTPIYFLFLSVPVLKKLLFRLFGYRGQMDFTIYPDTWVRDLPVLDFGKGAYLSNRATIGTNVALSSGDILVDRITVEEKGLVGHLSIIGPGVRVGKGAEVGIFAGVGINTQIETEAEIGPVTILEHGVTVGPRAKTASCTKIGSGSVVEEGARTSFGEVVPRRGVVRAMAKEEASSAG